MIVAFLHVGADIRLPTLMVRSVKRSMPSAHVVQMTDDASPIVPGVDWSLHKPYDGERLMTYRLEHLADAPPGPMVVLDTDVIVQRDLSPLFLEKWDVCLTERTGPILDKSGTDVAKLYPYNTGVMLSRSSSFWSDCYEWCKRASDELQRWYGDQAAVVAMAGKYETSTLPCDPFNYSPGRPNEDLKDKVVVHFKGRRKEWMPAYAARHLRPS